MKSIKLVFLLLVAVLYTHILFAQSSAHTVWNKERRAEIVAEDGWLNLAGLLWIDEKKAYLNQYSADSLYIADTPNKSTIGKYQFERDSVWFEFNAKNLRKSKGNLSPRSLQFPVKEYGQGAVTIDRWKWTVINRGGEFAVRLRNLKHPSLSHFDDIAVYDYDSTWRLKAFFEPKFNQFISITNVLGQVIEWRVMGILKFEMGGVKQELITLEDSGKLFVIFSDDTNGISTYPSGRYLYVDYPDKSGNTMVDFNYAYNPPCAFTAFATCPIPPKENRLKSQILAGEKAPEGH
jgi:uncharacterized protein (DUF1684 family)